MIPHFLKHPLSPTILPTPPFFMGKIKTTHFWENFGKLKSTAFIKDSGGFQLWSDWSLMTKENGYIKLLAYIQDNDQTKRLMAMNIST